jgi:hypothetical protein
MELDAKKHQPILDAYIGTWFRWRKAIDEAETGDISGIIKLLHAGKWIPPLVQFWLADFLECHQVKKKQGGQRRLNLSPEECKLVKASYSVREAQRGWATFDSAVDAVAAERNISPLKLANFMRGKGSRRSRRFRPPR